MILTGSSLCRLAADNSSIACPSAAGPSAAAGRLPVSATSKRVLDALQSLTPAEVERLQAAIRQEQRGAAR